MMPWLAQCSIQQGCHPLPEHVEHLEGHPLRPFHSELCCGDLIFPTWLVAFEHEVYGTVETFIVEPYYNPSLLSALDGVPSVAPNAGGFAYVFAWTFGGPSPRYFVTWTDGPPIPGPHVHQLAYVGYGSESFAGFSYSAVGATEGNPLAMVMMLWVELRDGFRTLVSRRGRLPGQTAVDRFPQAGRIAIDVAPNPCRDATTFSLRVPSASKVKLQIRDIAGRVVRDFGWVGTAGGTSAATWDTRDASGRLVGPGLYFAALSAGETRTARAFIVLR